MRRLVTIDLPRRLSRRLPRAVTEVAVGLALTVTFVLLRAVLAPVPEQVAPFALGFLCVVLATLLAGWRSGAVALVSGQLLIWYFLLPVTRSFAIATPAIGYSLVLSTVTQALIVFALGLYQREMRRGELERARRINFLGHALREMDHRTKNNFQIVTSLLLLQANRSSSTEVQAALREAAERLQAVSAVYDALTPSSEGLGTVRLQDHLEEICGQIRRGMLGDGITLATDLEPLVVPQETAVSLGIVVNELVTNACKHAFPQSRGAITVRARRDGNQARVEVADDGCGLSPEASRKGGLGTRLIAAFVQRLKGRSEVRTSPGGTVHAILVPLA
ncbi:MAG TPA: histidine kinase dimerization/phosphoacceptor domain -containing protein [Allosphingosinicella sp.]